MNLEKCLRLIKANGFYISFESKGYAVYADLNPESLSFLSFKRLGIIILDSNLQDVLFRTMLNNSNKDILELLQCQYLFSNRCHSYFKCCIEDENG